MTSERAHGISEQPGDTCPKIDAVISEIREAIKCCERRFKTDEPEDLQRLLLDAQDYLDNLEDKLESIRAHVVKIRSWGQEWKDRALELDNYM